MIEFTNINDVNGWIGAEIKSFNKECWEILKGAGLKIMDAAKRPPCPVVTGRYRSSIHIEHNEGGAIKITNTQDKDNKGRQWELKFHDSPAEGEIFVGTNVNYAENVEKKYGIMKKAALAGQFYITQKSKET